MGKENPIADLHLHSRESHDSRTSIPDMMQRAQERGIQIVAFTNHDTVKGIDTAMNEAVKRNMIAVPAIEINVWKEPSYLHFSHVLGLGIDPELALRDGFHLRFHTLEEVADWVRNKMGGVLVAAHPYHTKGLGITSMRERELRKHKDKLDGIEVTDHGVIVPRWRRIAEELELAQIGTSDAHRKRQVGMAVTQIFGEVSTWQDVGEAIREKRVAPLEVMRFTETAHSTQRIWGVVERVLL